MRSGQGEGEGEGGDNCPGKGARLERAAGTYGVMLGEKR